MMDLENRVLSMVKTYFPDTPENIQVQVGAFLTAECWNMINEVVNETASCMRKQFERALGQSPRRKKKPDGGGTDGT